jgi:hypothetical protein
MSFGYVSFGPHTYQLVQMEESQDTPNPDTGYEDRLFHFVVVEQPGGLAGRNKLAEYLKACSEVEVSALHSPKSLHIRDGKLVGEVSPVDVDRGLPTFSVRMRSKPLVF